MAGKIEKRGNRYSFMVDLGRDPATGRRIRKRHSGYRTKKAAKEAQVEILRQVQTGMYVEPSKITLGEFLRSEWLPAIESNVKPATLASYRNLTGLATAHMGAVPLQSITPARLNRMYASLLKEGSRARNKDGKGAGKPLSPRTVQYVHAVLRKALNDAVKWSMLVRNPVLAADPPRVEPREVEAWDESQLGAFLNHVADDRLRAAWTLASFTGMRRGEILGLRWSDLDLSSGRLWVRQAMASVNYRIVIGSPKTQSARREIQLDAHTVEALVEHRQRQDGEREAYGPDYDREGDFVFRREDGSLIHPELFADWFIQRTKAAGLPRLRFHGLRHTHATLALKAGVPVHVVSRRLGHANIGITLQTYASVLPGMDRDAADTVMLSVLGAMAPNGHQSDAVG